jgi:predicted HicB family RNase H-like nuclease
MADKPRRPPRLDTKLDVRLTTKQYDASYAVARAERVSMAAWIRQVLQAAIDGRPPRCR